MSKSFGLVLGGGGARGLAHVGALRALNHLGYYPDVIVGVSMGAVVAATYSLNENWYKDLVEMDNTGFPTIPTFSTGGIKSKLKNVVAAKRVLQDNYFGWGVGERTVDWGRGVLKHLTNDKSLQDGRVPIYTSSTDLYTGKRVVRNSGNAVDAIYASSALAGILPPFADGQYLLVDGAYSDIAPVDVAMETGVDFVIAIDPSQKRTNHQPTNGLDVLLRSVEICQNEHADMRFNLSDIVLKPDFKHSIGTMEFQNKRDCIAAGARAVRRASFEIKRLMES